MHYMYGGQCVVPGARLAEVSSEHYMYSNNIYTHTCTCSVIYE